MNRLYYLLLTALIACPAVQAAVAITTNPVCKKLVAAIEQEQKVESCKTGWQNIVKSPIIKVEDHAQIITQALQLAQAQKAVFEEELTNVGDETKDRSRIKWGVGQLVLGTYFIAGALWTWIHLSSKILQQNAAWQAIGNIVYPEDLGVAYDPNDRKPLLTKTNLLLMGIGIIHITIINHLVGPYLIHKGYHNLKQGLNHKQLLQDKIANLDAIITYLQELQTNNQ